MNACNLCAWKCNLNRAEKGGVCGCGMQPKLALASVHMWEEPCISGTNGSGTIFFSGCNFKCEFCQNSKISQEGFGKEVSVERLSKIMLELQEKKVHNINFVSPTPYVYNIVDAIDMAKKSGLTIPIIYNTNSYETIETIQLLKGYVDVYLPDLKYYDNTLGLRLSKIPNYFEVATNAIQEMVNQVGVPQFDENGIIQKGVIVRHLVLPNHLTETKKVIEWIKSNLSKDIYVSIMAQYFPAYHASLHKDINRKLNAKEYSYVVKMSEEIENGYIQELGSFEEEYVPEFDLRGI